MPVIDPYKTFSFVKTLMLFTMLALAYHTTVNAESKPENTKGQLMQDEKILEPCPSSPNCVNSQLSSDKKHFIKALELKESDIEKNRNKLLEVLNKEPGVKIITIDNHYIKAEFTSKVFSFVDDVEFVITEKHIDVRSASRSGYYDLGANRKRIEHIRKLLNQQ
jgi:uncharacterized protein (DUF1499 family)